MWRPIFFEKKIARDNTTYFIRQIVNHTKYNCRTYISARTNALTSTYLHERPYVRASIDAGSVRVRLQEIPHTQLKSWLGNSASVKMEKQWGDLESFSGIGEG